MNVKKHFILLLTVILILSCLSLGGCSAEKEADGGKLKIIATIFPLYDFAKQVAGDAADVKMLLPAGTESHSYEPSAKDIISIQNCDLFIYIGGESDTWVDTILASLDKPIKTLKLMDAVELYEEETVEGMQAENEPEQGEESGAEYDEHIWTSPANAVKMVKAITDELVSVDPDSKEIYANAGDSYTAELQALDDDFKSFFATVENKTMVFGDRFPFLYFAKEFGITYYAAFPGCSSETEASAGTITTLINKVKDEGITTVFYIELTSHNIADTIASDTGTKTALFHSCHNVTADELKAGVTYISIMKNNLETLKEAMK